jgi:hypothetical protein
VRAATGFSLRRRRSTVGTLPQRAKSPGRAENKALDEEHQARFTILCSLQSTKQHLQDERVRRQQSTGVIGSAVNRILVGWGVVNRMVERVIVAGRYFQQRGVGSALDVLKSL